LTKNSPISGRPIGRSSLAATNDHAECFESAGMSDSDEQVRSLLEETLTSGRTPEEVCGERAWCLHEVRRRWLRIQILVGDLDRAFPSNGGGREAARVRATTELPTIAGYTLESVIGHGGMGVVYKARHLKLTRTVAIKMLVGGEYAPARELARLVREAQSIAVLRHPNIIQVFDVGDLDGRPYFTMEYLEGGSLSQKLAGVPQPGREAAAMVATLAEAIQVAHAAGIIHRDLKPANILLAADGAPKVSDFGLARTSTEASDLTLGGTRLGTPSYMSPEQAIGKRGTIGPSTDVYSLGAVLYEMLTGRPPFVAETPIETERQVIAEEPAPPSRLNAKVPRDLETVCLKCLCKDPDRRYASASDLADDLRRFLRGEPIEARPASSLERLGKWSRRHPVQTAVWVGSAAAVAGILGAILWTFSVRTTLAKAVADDLAEVVRLEHASEWRAARDMLERAKTRLGPAAGRDRLASRVSEIENELGLVDRLGAIRYERAAHTDVDFDRLKWWTKYRRAFGEAGLLAEGDSPEAFAARVARSPARTALVEAMDDMAPCAGGRGDLEWLFGATRLADPDPWRDRARNRAVWVDAAALAALAREAPVEGQPVQLLLNVAGQLSASNPHEAEALLRRVQAAHPSDYWANTALGDTLYDRRDAEAIGYFRAAIALQPQATAAHFSLGTALRAAGRTAEAIESMRRAVTLDPASVESRYNLAYYLCEARQLEEAVEQARILARFDPKHSRAPVLAGVALKSLGRFAEALESFQQAMDLEPEGTPQRARTERLYAKCKAEEAAAAAGMPVSPDASGAQKARE
jgi:serine/threonine-protein kinase